MASTSRHLRLLYIWYPGWLKQSDIRSIALRGTSISNDPLLWHCRNFLLNLFQIAAELSVYEGTLEIRSSQITKVIDWVEKRCKGCISTHHSRCTHSELCYCLSFCHWHCLLLKGATRIVGAEIQHLRLHIDDEAFDIELKPGLQAFYSQTFQFNVVIKDALVSIAMHSPSCWAKGSDPMASTRLFFSWILWLDARECFSFHFGEKQISLLYYWLLAL